MNLKIKNKEIAVPGEELGASPEFIGGAGTYTEENKIFANRLGLVSIEGKIIKLISLSGRYMPKRDDVIIGNVTDIFISGWAVGTNSAYKSMLSMKEATSAFIKKGDDLTKFFSIGDYIVAKITNVTSQKLVDLTMRGPGLRKLIGGRIINVNPQKVPRIIGKAGSMVGMIKKYTDCSIIVGQNGLVWIDGDPVKVIKAVNAIRMVEQKSHISGLTEKVEDFLRKD